MTSPAKRRRAAPAINELIDRALREPGEPPRRVVARWPTARSTEDLAERVRQRATRLARRERGASAEILAARDRLVLALYAHATPAGWHTGWCDGSLAADAAQAGIGGLLMNPSGRTVVEFRRRVAAASAFEAEIAALAAVLAAAHARGTRRLRVYSDCVAAVQLWHRRRDDPRLESVVTWAQRFRRVELCALPRAHNLVAHRLARA